MAQPPIKNARRSGFRLNRLLRVNGNSGVGLNPFQVGRNSRECGMQAELTTKHQTERGYTNFFVPAIVRDDVQRPSRVTVASTDAVCSGDADVVVGDLEEFKKACEIGNGSRHCLSQDL